jgi:hypothetical protein
MYKLFILGLPGSGKSTVSRANIRYVNQTYKNWFVDRCCDYDILYNMFKRDAKRKDFYPVKYGGFYVTNPTRYNKALSQLETESWSCKHFKYGLRIIEFARGDYLQALSLFPSLRLNDAYFLFINSDISACKTRIKARADHPRTLDDRYVSDYSFEAYYQRENQQYMTEVALQLKQRFGVPIGHI